MEGSRPWAWAENNIEEMMAKIVGKRHGDLSPALVLFDLKAE